MAAERKADLDIEQWRDIHYGLIDLRDAASAAGMDMVAAKIAEATDETFRVYSDLGLGGDADKGLEPVEAAIAALERAA